MICRILPHIFVRLCFDFFNPYALLKERALINVKKLDIKFGYQKTSEVLQIFG